MWRPPTRGCAIAGYLGSSSAIGAPSVSTASHVSIDGRAIDRIGVAHCHHVLAVALATCSLVFNGCNKAPANPAKASSKIVASLNTDDRKSMRRDAEIAFSSAKYDRAAELFSNLIAADPGNVSNYLWRAQAYQRQGKYSPAAKDLDRAIQLAPNDPEPLLHRSRLALQLGQVRAALADCDLAIQLGGKQTAGALVYRAGILLGQRKFQEALNDCNEAIQLDPELLIAYNNRGLANQSLERFEEALADFTRAIEGHRQFADPVNNRGALHMQLGNAEAALADLNEAIRLEPLGAAGYDNRSRLRLEQLNDPAGAEKDCTRLLQVVERESKRRGASATGPKIAAIYARRAESRWQMNQSSPALADCQAALTLDGNCTAANALLRKIAESTAAGGKQAAAPMPSPQNTQIKSPNRSIQVTIDNPLTIP